MPLGLLSAEGLLEPSTASVPGPRARPTEVELAHVRRRLAEGDAERER